MNDLYPNYYNQFSCLGSECIETCCQGWKIDVDQSCHQKYEELRRKFDDNKIDKFIRKNSSPTSRKFSFIEMKKNGFCPFLDVNVSVFKRNLVRIIYLIHARHFQEEQLILMKYR